MNYTISRRQKIEQIPYSVSKNSQSGNMVISCDWGALSEQLLQQWDQLTPYELEQTGHNRQRIAALIQKKYGVDSNMAENYLRNFERTLPLIGAASR